MSYEQLEYTSSFASEQCPEGYGGSAGALSGRAPKRPLGNWFGAGFFLLVFPGITMLVGGVFLTLCYWLFL